MSHVVAKTMAEGVVYERQYTGSIQLRLPHHRQMRSILDALYTFYEEHVCGPWAVLSDTYCLTRRFTSDLNVSLRPSIR